MRIFTAIPQLGMAALLSSCNQQHPASAIDPGLGLECYDIHSAALQPGTQYEGIEKLAANRITIRIMNGVDVVTLDCELDMDGRLKSTGN